MTPRISGITTLETIVLNVFPGMITILAWPARLSSQVYESYLNYTATRPTQAENNYSHDVQGITHDSDNWFISQVWGLWNIPVGLDLAGPIECGASGVICANMNGISQISAYSHIRGRPIRR